MAMGTAETVSRRFALNELRPTTALGGFGAGHDQLLAGEFQATRSGVLLPPLGWSPNDDARDVLDVGSLVVSEPPPVLEHRPFAWPSGARNRRTT